MRQQWHWQSSILQQLINGNIDMVINGLIGLGYILIMFMSVLLRKMHRFKYSLLKSLADKKYKRKMQEIKQKKAQHNQEQQLTFSIAPMIDISNTHFRYFIRLITQRSVVYTEMLHHDAVIHSHHFLLPFSPEEHPIVLQLGGSQPQKLAEAALLGQKYGYDQINLNVGCPSPRVQKGSFGACLMKEADLVRDCMQAMKKVVKLKCTVKCRLGIDDFDSYQFVKQFVSQVSRGGEGPITHFVIHARKAFLKGLNPAQNRSVPPLMYDRVYRLKQDFPKLSFEINGGLKCVVNSYKICTQNSLYGCMVGRLAYENPFELMKVDQIFYGEQNYLKKYKSDKQARLQIMLKYAAYIQKLQNGQIKDQFGTVIRKPNPAVLVKPIIYFYNGEKCNAKYRQYLSDMAKLKEGPLHIVIRTAAQLMDQGGFYTKWEHQGAEQIHENEEKKVEVVGEQQKK